MILSCSIQNALQIENSVLIDVRSPDEFEDDHIKNAINIPILNNAERVIIGTLYKKEGKQIALEKGLELISPKLPEIVNRCKEVSKGKLILLYCWRGGLRSHTVATILDLMGYTVYVIEGGYKAYRGLILSKLEGTSYPFQFITLYGLTGVGKTDILEALIQKGKPVIHLERLANNRGSVFGQVGLGSRVSQKQFEQALFYEIEKFKNEKHVFLEGESKRIGFVTLPDSFVENMKNGKKIYIRTSLKQRVSNIKKHYTQGKETHEELVHALGQLKKRLGSKQFKELNDELDKRNYDYVIEKLLISYYDHCYKHTQEDNIVYTLDVTGDDIDEAAVRIAGGI